MIVEIHEAYSCEIKLCIYIYTYIYIYKLKIVFLS